VRKSSHDAKVEKPAPARLRCAIYTRKSTEEGLDQEFNSLDAQREAAEAFIQSQRREGWIVLPEFYQNEGIDAVLENLVQMGATAVATSPYVMAPADEQTGGTEEWDVFLEIGTLHVGGRVEVTRPSPHHLAWRSEGALA